MILLITLYWSVLWIEVTSLCSCVFLCSQRSHGISQIWRWDFDIQRMDDFIEPISLRWICWTLLQPEAGNPQIRLYHDNWSCCVMASVRAWLSVQVSSGRGVLLCQALRDVQITSFIPESQLLLLSHVSRDQRDSSHWVRAEISLQRRTCCASSLAWPQQGQSAWFRHFQHLSHFPTPNIPEFHLEIHRIPEFLLKIHCCLEEDSCDVLFCINAQPTAYWHAKLVWTVPKNLHSNSDTSCIKGSKPNASFVSSFASCITLYSTIHNKTDLYCISIILER